jgi:uncharacterized protein (DUF2062 family)
VRVLVIVPVYNHASTLRGVVEGVLRVHADVLVVDDGSTDDLARAIEGLPVRVVRHTQKRGKGAAIMTACREAAAVGMTHILTIDADGQHDPAEIPSFLQQAASSPTAILVGKRDFTAPHVPAASRFGRSFGNFWLRIQTGVRIGDIQSGYRLYPVAVLMALPLTERGYAFEVEVLVRAAWAGVPLRDIEVTVYYPPAGERVSHFHAVRDNLRLSHVNALLTLRALLPWPHRKLVADRATGSLVLVRPMRSVRDLVLYCANPREIAGGAATGAIVAALPVLGFQGLITIVACSWFRFNKASALLTNQFGTPPLIQIVSIQTGHYIRSGVFLTTLSREVISRQGVQILVDWLIGSLVVGPLLGLVVWAAFYGVACSARSHVRPGS